MKIAIVHNDYGKPSGEEAVVSGLTELLRQQGHEAVRFSRSSAEIPQKPFGNLQAFLSGIYNPFSRRAFARFLDAQKPNVVHVHNLFPFISPSILPECGRRRVPVVMTLHNFRLLCPNALLMRRGELCHECLGGREWRCVRRNCERSLSKSLGYSLRTAFARRSGLFLRHVSQFICLTSFQREIYARQGFPPHRLTVIPNPAPIQGSGDRSQPSLPAPPVSGFLFPVSDSLSPVPRLLSPDPCPRVTDHSITDDSMTVSHPPSPVSRPSGSHSLMVSSSHSLSDPPSPASRPLSPDSCLPTPVPCPLTPAPCPLPPAPRYVAYVGRVSPEKDVVTLLAAARALPHIPFKIAGSYWRMPDLVRHAPPNVQFLGHLDGPQLEELFSGMALLAFATRCYENFPTVLLDAMVRRIPIVCTRIGGLPEIVEDGHTGLLYKPQDAADLAAKIRRLWEDRPLARQLAEAGAIKARQQYHPDSVCQQHLAAYATAIDRARPAAVPLATNPSLVS